MTSEDDTAGREECERELRRIVDRLNSMPLTRAATAATEVHQSAAELVRLGRLWGVPMPAEATLPTLEPQGFGSMLAVLGRDCLDAAGADTDLAPLLATLVSLRRALP